MPEYLPTDAVLLLMVVSMLIGGLVVMLHGHGRVSRANTILATHKGLGRDWLVPAPPTGSLAARRGLPAWVHLYTRHGRLDRRSGIKNEVPVVVEDITSEQRAVKPCEPDAVGLESGPVVMPVSRADRVWAQREQRSWRAKGGPLPHPYQPAQPERHSLRARAGTAVGQWLRDLRPVPRSAGRHRAAENKEATQ